MLDWMVAAIMFFCGAELVYLAVRYPSRPEASRREEGLMFLLFGRSGFRVFWIIFGLVMIIAAALIIAHSAGISG